MYKASSTSGCSAFLCLSLAWPAVSNRPTPNSLARLLKVSLRFKRSKISHFSLMVNVLCFRF
ncbi:unnamed protein product [Acanthoscelides obtectus]|uniref:Secreted protein n=1 Tax=Acanthoscelides obtectus TaxID=200917 RepID=A0A9P0MGE7_ACAOB|nr:unnamed protein product [Acanthoscelides obtectus]CAK1629876.1 hypothetical protein AOBTE_LOCUS6012 [Acanthoscelides obtectus]